MPPRYKIIDTQSNRTVKHGHTLGELYDFLEMKVEGPESAQDRIDNSAFFNWEK